MLTWALLCVASALGCRWLTGRLDDDRWYYAVPAVAQWVLGIVAVLLMVSVCDSVASL